MNGWTVAFWAVVVLGGAAAVAGVALEDAARRCHARRAAYLDRWITEHRYEHGASEADAYMREVRRG